MQPNKNILLIDDESQRNELESIKISLRAKLNISYTQIEVLSEEHLNQHSELDFAKLKECIYKKLKAPYDLILVDFDYGPVGITGLDVVKVIKEKRPHSEVVLYSADQKKVIKYVVGKGLSDTSLDDIVNGVNSLMKYKIRNFFSRPSYVTDVIGLLNNDLGPSPNAVLCSLLRDNRDRVFSSCSPKLQGMTFGELADLLEEDNDGRAHEWLKAVIEQTMAYLVEVNE